MKKIGFILVFLSLVSLFALNSCSTSKKTTNRNKNTNIALTAPDYKQIKKEIENKNSEFYYPELLRRFMAADTTLTAEQVHYFYYGTATRPDYDPYFKRIDYEEINGPLRGETITEENWRKAAQSIDAQLESDPTQVRLYVYKDIVYSNLYGEGSEEAQNAHNQVHMLALTIMATGDGKSPETAMHVIRVTDEYAIMDLLELNPKGQSLIEKNGRSCDQIELEENEFGLESMYFDVTACLKTLVRKKGPKSE